MFWIKLYFQKPKIFTGDKCGVVKRSKEQIDKHSTAHEKGILHRKVCKKSYDDRTHLDEHQDKHTKEHRYTCKETIEGGQNMQLNILGPRKHQNPHEKCPP